MTRAATKPAKEKPVYKLSPSSLNLLKDCPRCFWLHHNRKVTRPAGIFPSLPSGMDRVLKEHFDHFAEKGTLPPELKEIDGDGLKLFDNKELLEEWTSNRRGIKWADEQGNVLRGAVDYLLLEKDGKIIVVDFKTRGFELKEDTHHHYIDQIDIYNFLLRKNGFPTADNGYLLFFYPNKVLENGDVVFHKKLITLKISVENAERIFRNAIKVLQGDMPKAKEKCKWCAWIPDNAGGEE